MIFNTFSGPKIQTIRELERNAMGLAKLTIKEAFCITARDPLNFFLPNLQLNTFKKQLLKRGPIINRFSLYEDDDQRKWRERHGCDESGKKGGSICLSTFEEENGHLPQVEVDEMPETRRKLL